MSYTAPTAALEAAKEAVDQAMVRGVNLSELASAALEAGAPFIQAEALREAAHELLNDETAEPGSSKRLNNRIYAAWLTDRAADIERDNS